MLHPGQTAPLFCCANTAEGLQNLWFRFVTGLYIHLHQFIMIETGKINFISLVA